MSNYGHKYHGVFDMQSNDVYYKLQRLDSGIVTVTCLQWFDEPDYHQESFIRNSDNEIHAFETEEMAITKLNIWFKKEEIDPEYYIGHEDGIEVKKNVRD